MNTPADTICIIELHSIKVLKTFPKPTHKTKQYEVGSEVNFLDIFLAEILPLRSCTFSRLLISFTLGPRKFLSRQKPKQETSYFIGSWLCCKGKVSVSGSLCWIPGQHSVWFCLKREFWNLFASLRLHKHSQPISNSAQLCSDQWNHQLGFRTKFGHGVITGINTCCKMCLDCFLSYEVRRIKKKEWMKMRAEKITELSVKCCV